MPGKENSVKIRRARQAHAARIAELSGQFGYPATGHAMAGRLKMALREKSGACFVAEMKENGVVGWAHASVRPSLEVERRAELNGLVVDERVRSQGAGWSLLQAAEEWARKKRCKGMSVRSNVLRDRAHGFYERHGYEHYKTQKAFRKKL